MDGEIDKFLCFTEISIAESKVRNEQCVCKNETSDIKNHISSKKERWYIKLVKPCKLEYIIKLMLFFPNNTNLKRIIFGRCSPISNKELCNKKITLFKPSVLIDS